MFAVQMPRKHMFLKYKIQSMTLSVKNFYISLHAAPKMLQCKSHLTGSKSEVISQLCQLYLKKQWPIKKTIRLISDCFWRRPVLLFQQMFELRSGVCIYQDFGSQRQGKMRPYTFKPLYHTSPMMTQFSWVFRSALATYGSP